MSKQSKIMCVEFFPEACPFSRYWQLIFYKLPICLSPMIRALILVLLSSLAIGCSQKPGIAKNSSEQFYQDVTKRYLPLDAAPLQGATFARVDRAPGIDLIGFVSTPSKGAKIKIFINKGNRGIGRTLGASSVQHIDENIRFLAAEDVDGNGVDDLILITSSKEKESAKILFNNGRGYFFSKNGVNLPLIYRSVERADLVDIDQDGDADLIFTGRRVLRENGQLHRRQGQVLVNIGKRTFEDETTLLWPELPPGVVGTSIADYDKDGFPDVFLVYGNGQNRLLMNNGVGQFVDKTDRLLPKITDQSTHADWADFDLDGDNDLLVTNKLINVRYRSYSQETSYFLENGGYGRFSKRSNKKLPSMPAFRVYLLDSNGTGIPDVIILNANGPYYMVGKGNWNFSVETSKRLPEISPMKKISFGDINNDGFLDFLGITESNNSPKLWLNRVD